MPIALGIAAGGCTVLGAGLTLAKKDWKDHELALVIGIAFGVMIGVVIFDLIPAGLLYHPAFTGVGAIFGWLLISLLKSVVAYVPPPRRLLMFGSVIMLALAFHDLPEGMLLAITPDLTSHIDTAIGMAISLHNLPEGIAMATPLLMSGQSKLSVFFRSITLGSVTPVGALIGTRLLKISPWCLPLILGLSTGVIANVAIRELWPEAKARSPRNALYGACAGLLMALAITAL